MVLKTDWNLFNFFLLAIHYESVYGDQWVLNENQLIIKKNVFTED